MIIILSTHQFRKNSIDLLIGMDIIQLGDFHISNTGGHTLFSFVVPPLPEQFDLTKKADVLNNQV